jgi:transcriptional regulator with XRE-family HTH domain
MRLPDEIRRRMALLGHSTASLAAAAGVRQSYIKDILARRSRRMEGPELERIAAVLGCTLDDLKNPIPRQASGSARVRKLAEVNAKLQSIPTKDLDIVLRLLDAVRPRDADEVPPDNHQNAA